MTSDRETVFVDGEPVGETYGAPLPATCDAKWPRGGGGRCGRCHGLTSEHQEPAQAQEVGPCRTYHAPYERADRLGLAKLCPVAFDDERPHARCQACLGLCCEHAKPPSRTAPQAAGLGKITDTVTVPTRENDAKLAKSLDRDAEKAETTASDMAARWLERQRSARGSRGARARIELLSIERSIGWHRGRAAGLREASLALWRLVSAP